MSAIAYLHGLVGEGFRSITLDHCWVCNRRFSDKGGSPDQFRHEHHMVPRAYGGVDGPTVSLCDSHHTALHRIALKLEKGKPYSEFLTNNRVFDKKLIWLASIVVNAKHYAGDDPNKPTPILLVAKGDTKKKLKQLKTLYPKASYSDVIEYAVAQLYSKHFQD